MTVAIALPTFAIWSRVGDRLTVHGVVKERVAEAAGTRVVVEVWCENQDGDKTAVDTASGMLAR